MAERADNWSTQQLTEFLALVSSFADGASATRAAVQRAAEVLDAEVVAVIRDAAVSAAIGYPAGALTEGELVELVDEPQRGQLTGLGPCHVAVVRLEFEDPGHLLVARTGGEGFTCAEHDLLRGMAGALAMTSRMFHRQHLLERLSALQRMIVRRAEPADVLHAVVTGVAELVGADVVSVRLIDPHDHDVAVLMASVGLDPEVRAQTERT
jgi:hypothetical protein